MAHRLSLEIRKTNGWSYLDEWEDLGQAKLLAPRRDWYSLIFDKPQDTEKAVRAIYGTFSAISNCRHEHDCCGCKFTFVSEVIRKSKRKYLFKLYQRRNV